MTAPASMDPAALDRLEERYEEACYAMGLASWNHYSKEGPADLDGARRRFAGIFSDESTRRSIDASVASLRPGGDPRWARRLEMWRRAFTGGRIEGDPEIAPLENELEKRLTAFELRAGGEAVSRAQITVALQECLDTNERRRFWQAAGDLHEVMEADFRALVAVRNRRARELGFSNFYQLSLYLQGLEESWLVSLLRAVEDETRRPLERFLDLARSSLALETLHPWDLRHAVKLEASLPDDRFPKEAAFTVLKSFYAQIGFPVSRLAIREVVADIPFGGLSLAIHIPTDSRFLVNPTRGHSFYATAFHEYGHSLHAVYTAVEEPIFKGYEWIPGAHAPAYAEGVAEAQAEFVKSALWLARYTRVSQAERAAYERGAARAAVLRLRQLLFNFWFEYEMYRNPDQDLTALERKLTERFLLVERGSEERPHWAGDTWYTTYPCYYQNYVLAAMMASQIQKALEDTFGAARIEHPEVAGWFIENLYRMGESVEWPERLRRATGRSLDSRAYLEALGRDSSEVSS